MKIKSPIENRTNLIAARVNTTERLQAENVMQKLGVDSYGQLFRRLLNEKVKDFGMRSHQPASNSNKDPQ